MRSVGRILLIVVGIVVGIVVVVGGAGLLIGKAKLDTTYAVAPEQLALSVPIDTADVARGRHFATGIAGCIDCHGAHLQGTVFLDVPPFRMVAPNLTRGQGGIGGTFTDADFVRAIRHGVGPDGRGLYIMPAGDYSHLSDQDLADIIAYVKSVPPVDNVMAPKEMRPLGLLLLAFGQVPPPDAATIDHSAVHPTRMSTMVDARYGQYLATIGGCTGCHGAGLSGGPIVGMPPGSPVAANITPAGIGTWTESDFARALRVGKRPDGTTLNSLMPWAYYTRMTDAEIRSLWLYVHSVAPRQTGMH
jgi:mono/diheme cytochrome c family protein